jgi:hypothetical protein
MSSRARTARYTTDEEAIIYRRSHFLATIQYEAGVVRDDLERTVWPAYEAFDSPRLAIGPGRHFRWETLETTARWEAASFQEEVAAAKRLREALIAWARRYNLHPDYWYPSESRHWAQRPTWVLDCALDTLHAWHHSAGGSRPWLSLPNSGGWVPLSDEDRRVTVVLPLRSLMPPRTLSSLWSPYLLPRKVFEDCFLDGLTKPVRAHISDSLNVQLDAIEAKMQQAGWDFPEERSLPNRDMRWVVQFQILKMNESTIAERAKVEVSTVSKAFNGEPARADRQGRRGLPALMGLILREHNKGGRPAKEKG